MQISVISNEFSPFRITELPTIVYISVILSFFFHVLLYLLCFPICKLLFPVYSNLSSDEKAGWNSRILSNLNGIVAFCFGSFIFFTTPQYFIDHDMKYADIPSAILFAYTSGYFLWDIILLVLVLKDDRIFIFHHIIILFSMSLMFVLYRVFLFLQIFF